MVLVLGFLLASLFFPPSVNAQEGTNTRTIIIQTDLEEPVANQTVICKQIPKKLGQVSANEITLHELTTNDSGEAVLGVTDSKNMIFTCETKEKTTTDYCWYFPHATSSFDIFDDSELNKPVYIVGQKSPETCNKEFSQEQLDAGITALLPQGTVLPFTNKNLIPETPKPQIIPESTQQPTDETLTLWQWLFLKLRAIF